MVVNNIDLDLDPKEACRLYNLPASQGLDYIWYVSDLHLEFIDTYSNLVSYVNNLFDSKKYRANISFEPYLDTVNGLTEHMADKKILILAGDICNAVCDKTTDVNAVNWRLRYFLNECSKRFRWVLYTAGNHEYYNVHFKGNKDIHTIEHIDGMLDGLCLEYWNVYYMQCDKFIIDNVEFIGCTLWSDIDTSGFKNYLIRTNINDYKYITNLNIYSSNEYHQKHLKYLTQALYTPNLQWLDLHTHNTHNTHNMLYDMLYDMLHKTTNNIINALGLASYNMTNMPNATKNETKHTITDKKVVFTHHAPRNKDTSAPEFANSAYLSAFSTDLPLDVINSADAWICGHTHHKAVISNVEGTKCTLALNCIGYPS